MATLSTHPLGPVAATPETKPQSVLVGEAREAKLPTLTLRSMSPEDEFLYVDAQNQPWVDRPSAGENRELVQVCWKEVCLNWPSALCADELEN